MVQGYTQQDSGSKGGWASYLGSGRAEAGKPFPITIFYSNEAFRCSYSRRVANEQWTAYLPEEPKLSQDFLDKQKEYDVRLSKLDAVLSDVDEVRKYELFE